MTIPAGFKGLLFPSECVSSRPGGYSDPWAEITRNRLLPNGTKEEILNVLAHEPKTITQVAEALRLSAPTVHTHISEMGQFLWERRLVFGEFFRATKKKQICVPPRPL